MNHLHLKVRDLETSIAFYNQLFGFKEKARLSEDLIFIKNNSGFDLALAKTTEVKSLPAGIHFGFSLRSKDELLKAFEQVQLFYPLNLASKQITDHGNWGTFVCFDPDGYPIEVYWDPFLA